MPLQAAKSADGISRRGFLTILAVAGGVGFAAQAGLKGNRRDRVRIVRSRVAMGTIVTLTLLAEDRGAAETAAEAAFARMDSLEEILSRHRAGSEVSRLNRDGCLIGASPELTDLVKMSTRLSRTTEGAFDITMMPLLEAYKRAREERTSLPSRSQLSEALARVGSDNLVIEGPDIWFARPRMAITLDGIAKGYIVDRAVDELRYRGFPSVLVEASGDLSAKGSGEDGEVWKIGISSPRRRETIEQIELGDRAVATSGDSQFFFSDDRLHHHIIDPRRGESSPDLASVTVVAPSVMLADALATTVMVSGVERGRATLEAMRNVEALMVTKDLDPIATSGFEVLRT